MCHTHYNNNVIIVQSQAVAGYKTGKDDFGGYFMTTNRLIVQQQPKDRSQLMVRYALALKHNFNASMTAVLFE
jgi:hypothetical protein